MFLQGGLCLGHAPHPSCAGFADRRGLQSREPELHLGNAAPPRAGSSGDSGGGGSSSSSSNRRALQSPANPGPAAFSPAEPRPICGALGSGGCQRRQEVIFGVRRPDCEADTPPERRPSSCEDPPKRLLTAPMLRAMCRWEEAVHAHASFK